MNSHFISAVCCTYGRTSHLREALACFANQDYQGPRELLIVNSFPPQTLLCSVPNVRIINLKERPKSLGETRNLAVREAAGQWILNFDDDDLALPNCLRLYAEAFASNDVDWVRLNPTWYADGWKVIKPFGTWVNAVGMRKSAFLKVGGYQEGLSVGEDRALWKKLSEQCKGVTVELKPEEIPWIYCWGNDAWHLSGQGDDREGLAPAYLRSKEDLERRVSQGCVPLGEITLIPALEHDPVAMVNNFIANEQRRSKKNSVCLVELGKYGDIINILPVALHMHNTYGKPFFMVSSQYADIMDGVSYVTPCVTTLRHEQLHEALAEARERFDTVINCQIWAADWTQERTTESYNKESWRVAGFLPQFDNPTWRPLFDKQDCPRAEAVLHKARLSDRPFILTNLTRSSSSPFSVGPAILSEVQERFKDDYQILEVGGLELHRIFDLIPFIEQASAVVSIDTSLIHLAAATNTPLVALVNPQPWLGSSLRSPHAERIPYDQASGAAVCDAIQRALIRDNVQHTPEWNNVMMPKGVVARRIFHAVSPADEVLPVEIERKKWAKDSWKVLYETHGVIPCPFTELKRAGHHTVGRSRLPFLKDILEPAIQSADDEDIIFYTNDDIICHPNLPEQLRFYCGVYGAVASQRCEIAFTPPPALTASPVEWAAAAQNKHIPHFGRDTFAFTKRWIASRFSELPDFMVGATDWDNCMVFMVRRESGYLPDAQALRRLIWPAEMPMGYTAHIFHRSTWQAAGNYGSSDANKRNRSLFRDWAKTYGPNLHFDESNQLLA